MESMVQALDSSFSSSRLLYRPLEDSNQHNDHLYRYEWSSPLNNGLSTTSTLKPINRKESDQRNAWIIQNSLIAVVLVLRPSDSSTIPESFAHMGGSFSGDELIGHLHLTKPGQFGRDTSIGLSISPEYQGKGYGREAINWALDYAFKYAGVHRVEIGTVGFNERAVALYKSIGFVEEGRKRKSAFFNGQWHDQVEMAMLEEEYRFLREE